MWKIYTTYVQSHLTFRTSYLRNCRYMNCRNNDLSKIYFSFCRLARLLAQFWFKESSKIINNATEIFGRYWHRRLYTTNYTRNLRGEDKRNGQKKLSSPKKISRKFSSLRKAASTCQICVTSTYLKMPKMAILTWFRKIKFSSFFPNNFFGRAAQKWLPKCGLQPHINDR